MRALDNVDRTLLQLLRLYGLIHCSQLARAMERSRDFMKERVRKLEAAGYVHSVSNPSHREMKLLALTPEGNRIALEGYSPLRQLGA